VSALNKESVRTAQKTLSTSVTQNQSVNVVQDKSPFRTLNAMWAPCRLFEC